MDWLWLDDIAPFSFALLLMLGLGAIEMIGLFFGLSSLSHSPDTDIDADLNLDGANQALSSLLSWLHIGRAPLLILLIFFLLGFGLTGIVLQQLCISLLDTPLDRLLIAIPSLIMGLTHMNWGGRFVTKYLPKDETESISSDSFIGKTVTITVGEARVNSPAEAKFKDEFGYTHYMMVEPDDNSYYFKAGETALIIKQQGSIYHVVPNIDYLLSKTRNPSL